MTQTNWHEFNSTYDVLTVFSSDEVFIYEIIDVGAEKVTCDDPFRQSWLVIGWRPAPWSHLSVVGVAAGVVAGWPAGGRWAVLVFHIFLHSHVES